LNKTLKQEKAMKVLSLVGLFALFLSPLQAQEQKDVAVTQLLSTTRTSSGQPIGLPQKDAQIVASVYDVGPGTTVPVHNHPYPRYGYVLAGILPPHQPCQVIDGIHWLGRLGTPGTRQRSRTESRR